MYNINMYARYLKPSYSTFIRKFAIQTVIK